MALPIQRPLFQDLPLELRRKVWEAASFIPRNVDVWHKNIYTSKEDRAGAECVHYRMISRTPPPAILHVCQESREVALKHYKLAFGTTKDCGTFSITSKPRIYINPIIDTICLPRPYGFWDHPIITDGSILHIDNRAGEFAELLRDLKICSLAVNLCGNIGDPSFVISHAIIPKNLGVLKEIIYFWDSDSHEYVDENWDYDAHGEKRLLYDRVKFVDVLTPEEMNPDLPTTGPTFEVIGFLTDAYYEVYHYIGMALSREKEPMRLREMYSQLEKRFCKQEGRWRSVAWSY